MSSAREQAGAAGGPADDGEARAKVIPIGTGRGARSARDGRGGRGSRAAQRRTEELTDPTLPAEPEVVTGAGTGPEAAAAPESVPQAADERPEREPGRGVADSVADAVGHALAGPLGGLAGRLLGKGWEERAAGGLGFLRRRLTGEYEVDEFGFDPELTEKVLLTAVRPLAEKYFRLEVRGAENLPEKGGALVVANHSGVLPLDALMTQVAIHDHTPTQRHLRMLAADLVFVLPGVNELARKAGHTLACNEDAQRLLELGEIVGVWPEGFKGIGKPFADRYKLQRFGRGGFVSSALRAGVPIVPCSIVGAEEIYPMIGNARTLARLLGLPYVPITPTFPWLGPLGAVPLPTKWTIQFGEPIPTDSYPPEAADDPMLLFNLTDEVRETVQHTLYKLLVQRRSVFF